MGGWRSWGSVEFCILRNSLGDVERAQTGLDMIVRAHLQGHGSFDAVGGRMRGQTAAVDEDISASGVQSWGRVGARHRWHAGDAHQ